jgi:hypothetical protein
MKVAELKRLVTVGKKVILTESTQQLSLRIHPYLNKEREVTYVNTVGFGLTYTEDGKTSILDWPKASQLSDGGTDDKGRYFKVTLPHVTMTYLVLDEH